jgi:hypothetical protein
MPIASSITPVQDSRFVESTLSLSRDTAPPLRPLIAGSLFAILACVLTGPFDTDVLPLPSRLVFWLVLIGWNSVKWWLWYGWVGPRTTDRRTAVLAAVVGALLLNATLPLEIDVMFRAIGRPLELSWLGLYLMALLVAGSISALIAALRGPSAVPVTPIVSTPSLFAQRAGLPDLAGVLSVTAEDHYLRLVLADGRKPLVLADGSEQAVSETFLPAVRAAGWLQTKL